jgi:CSLREA domain-containing protein
VTLFVPVIWVATHVGAVAHAATITVNALGDPGDGTCNATECTLREAITAALASDTIDFSVTGTITLAGSQLTVDKDLIISGPGASQLTIDGDGRNRVFAITSGAVVTISSVTITGGNDNFEGGGLFNGGILTLTDSVVSGNTASVDGGGIADIGGPTLILRSTISNNTAMGCCGGGILHSGPAKMTIDMSTIADNTSAIGGGIFNNYLELDIINSTIAGNSATSEAGGIACDYPPTITNSTVSGNTASERGGGVSYFGPPTLVNSILALNTAPTGPDCSIPVESLGNNILGDVNDCTITLLPSDIVGDPGLGIFIDSSIPGQGHIPLLLSSQAIDSGNDDACPPTDQLGVSRPQDGDGDGNAICDIGAYEFVLPYIEVEIDIKPKVLNLKSKGKRTISLIRLSEEYAPHDIAIGSIELSVPSCSHCEVIYPTHELPLRRNYLALFRRQDLIDEIEKLDRDHPVKLDLKITGEFNDGTSFEGLDTIQVIRRGK